jgi:hypothetical protein
MLHRTSVVIGTSRHFAAAQQTVAFGVKADIEFKRGAGVNAGPFATRAHLSHCNANDVFNGLKAMFTVF